MLYWARRVWAGWHLEDGGALVEMALVTPLFVTMLLGAVEFGRLAYSAMELSDAAFAGASYGAQSRAMAANTSGMVSAATATAQNVPGMTADAAEAAPAPMEPL